MLSFLSILVPFISGFYVLKMKFSSEQSKEKIIITATALTTVLTILNNILYLNHEFQSLSFPMGLNLFLKVDLLSVLFTTLFVIIWCLVTIYSFEYMSHSDDRQRFQAYFLATLGGLLGVAYAGNLFTMYMFFEITSILCYVLVVNEKTKKSMNAGKKFIYYSLFGAGLGLISIFYIYFITENPVFTQGGIIGLPINNDTLFFTVLAVIGFGCKAGMFPLHGWLSTAHPQAPAPASSILSGVVTKAGIIAIIRIVFYTIGAKNLQDTWAQYIILSLALLTIFMGSMLAFLENNFKKRLAYSTVSQVSYIIFGLFLLNEVSFIGAVLQIIFHMLAKNLLFIIAGIVIFKTNIHNCDKLDGLGARFKSVFILFTVASMSLVGVPFTGGFVSKWYLAEGALQNDTFGFFGVCMIMISAVLTAGYLFSIVTKTLFYEKKIYEENQEKVSNRMLVPAMILAVLIVILGVYPNVVIDFAKNLASNLI